MAKKLKKTTQGGSIDLDQRTLDALCIDETTDLDLLIKDGSLVITPRQRKDELVKKKQKKFEESAKNLMKKYEPVLKKLAKT